MQRVKKAIRFGRVQFGKEVYLVVALWFFVTSGQNGTAQTRDEKKFIDYGPKIVSLGGYLTQEKRYGPPNYGENPDRDEKLTMAVLHLQRAIHMCGRPHDFDREALRNIRDIQLQISDVKLWRIRDKLVRVTGTLYRGFSGHHFTDVLMSVQTMKLESAGDGKRSRADF